MAQFKDLTNEKVGRFTFIERVPNAGRRTQWKVLCECGLTSIIKVEQVKFGNNPCQGCKKPGKYTHGLSATPTYKSWASMHDRCNASPDNKKCYKTYVLGGIKVCERWDSIHNFIEDMGERPPGGTIDRIDGTRGYEPGNCRWLTQQEQCWNLKTNVLVEFNGESKPMSQWCAILGISYGMVWQRINKGWSVEQALTLAPGTFTKHRGRKKGVKYERN